ncbi:MAG: hypothetical protein JWO82_4243, partial [Akkermansiaceae bacterium]|nr:hypothetical protein [Akkermansiaceae bacterium]
MKRFRDRHFSFHRRTYVKSSMPADLLANLGGQRFVGAQRLAQELDVLRV